MTRKTIPTKQQADDMLLDTIDKFDNMTVKPCTGGKSPQNWNHESRFAVNNGSNDSYIFLSGMPSKQDIKVIKKALTSNWSNLQCGVQRNYMNKDEEVTGKYFNPYMMVDLENHYDEIPEYIPKELPPLYDCTVQDKIFVMYGPDQKGKGGSVIRTTKQMIMFLSNDKPSTFFHELGHCYDYMYHKDKQQSVVDNEIVAELTSCVLSRLYGSNRLTSCKRYIANHTSLFGEDDLVVQGCKKVLDRTKNVLHSILTSAEKSKCKKILE